MDFFEAQEAARRRTALLVVYYLIAVVLIVISLYAAAVLIHHYSLAEKAAPLIWWQPKMFAGLAAGVIVVIAAGSLYKSASLKSGGGAVAKMLGGRLVEPNTASNEERRLVNVVEEMAIASGVRVPEIYVLPEQGINAFAAGFSSDDAAVAVTEGCLKALNRDQLQGVIAHEFSHILNGDMRLNIRLIGILFGILLLAITGQILFRSTARASLYGGRRRNSKGGGIVIVIILAGLALVIIGYIGVFFGRLIQSAVSRQREFLADASAVQFTRNPDGLTGALKQIGAWRPGSVLASNHATEASHLFFANGLGKSVMDLFATHPPLAERIQAIEPSFDGDFSKIKPPRKSAQEPAASKKPGTGQAALSRDAFITQVGTLAGITLASASAALDSIPEEARMRAHDPESAQALVLALLLDADPAIRDRQLRTVRELLGHEFSKRAIETATLTRGLDREQRLTVLDLALPTLKRIPVEDRPVFHQLVNKLIQANEDVSLFEFAVQQMLRRYVPLEPRTGKPRVADFYAMKPMAASIALILSTLADSGHGDEPEVAEQAYRTGAERIDEVRSLPRPEVSGLKADQVAAALDHLSRASLPICKRALDACVQTAGFDGTIEASEAELLRAISATVDCPVPPLN